MTTALLAELTFWFQVFTFGGLFFWSIFRLEQAGLRWLGVTTFASVGLVLTLIGDVAALPPEAWPRSLSLFMVWVAVGIIAILAARHVHKNRNRVV